MGLSMYRDHFLIPLRILLVEVSQYEISQKPIQEEGNDGWKMRDGNLGKERLGKNVGYGEFI